MFKSLCYAVLNKFDNENLDLSTNIVVVLFFYFSHDDTFHLSNFRQSRTLSKKYT